MGSLNIIKEHSVAYAVKLFYPLCRSSIISWSVSRQLKYSLTFVGTFRIKYYCVTALLFNIKRLKMFGSDKRSSLEAMMREKSFIA